MPRTDLGIAPRQRDVHRSLDTLEAPELEDREGLSHRIDASERHQGRLERPILGAVDDDLRVGGSSRILSRLSGPGAACRPRQDRGRRLNSSQVADAWISPLTNLQPPSASGGNMYVQRSHRIPGSGAGL